MKALSRFIASPAGWLAPMVLGLLLTAACTGPPPSTSPIVAPTTPVPASPSATVEETSKTVTLADDGHTLTLGSGERFLLKLGEDCDWTVTIADEAIVSRVISVLVVRGAQGLYEAHQAGSTTLTATGNPACRNAQPPCAAPLRDFRLEVIVK